MNGQLHGPFGNVQNDTFELPGQQDLTNFNLNNILPIVPLLEAVSGIGTDSIAGNDYSISYSNQNDSHFVSLPSTSSNGLINVHVAAMEEEDDARKSAERKKKKHGRGIQRTASTLTLWINAYDEQNPGISKGCVQIENRDLSTKSTKVRERIVQTFKDHFWPPPPPPVDNKWAFEFPRQQPEKREQAQVPEVAQFKASQKLFNPGDPVPDARQNMRAVVAAQPEINNALLQYNASLMRGVQVQLGRLQDLADNIEQERMEEDDPNPLLAAQEDLAKLQDTQTPKKKRKKTKSQATKAREKSVRDKNKRAAENIENGSIPSTPKGRAAKSQRSDVRMEELSPYPLPFSPQPVRQVVRSSIRPLAARQLQYPGYEIQVLSDVRHPTQRAQSLMDVDEEEVENENGVTMDENGIFRIEDEEAIRQRDPVVPIDDDEEPIVAPPIITIDDRVNTQTIREIDERPYAPNEANLRDVVFNSVGNLNAINLGPSAWLSGEQLTAYHCGFIPHHTFKRWNQIAFLDPAWQQSPRTPITKFLRVHSDMPELIVCHLNVRGNHWTVLLINALTGKAKYYDPLMKFWQFGEFETEEELAEEQLCLGLLERLRVATVIGNYELKKAEWWEFNQQYDSDSCGYFGIILIEDFVEFGFTRKWDFINIQEERIRINRIIHMLACLNQHPPDDATKRWKRTLEFWPERPCREDLQHRAIQIQVESQPSELAEDNTLIQKVDAKPDVKQIIRPPLRKSQRLINQHKPRDPALVAADIRSLQVRGVPIAREDSEIFPDQHYLGPMNKRCKFCKAYLFQAEDCNKCCARGTIPPPPVHEIPPEFEYLRRMPEFWAKIRLYNTLYAMVSMSAKVQMIDGIFKIQGEPQFNVGDLIPRPGQPERFAQIYTVLGDEAIKNRRMDDLKNMGFQGKREEVSEAVLGYIESMLQRCHPLVKKLKTMRELLAEEEAKCAAQNTDMKKMFIVWEDPYKAGSGGTHPGCLNVPQMPGQVFKLWKSGDDGHPPSGIYFGFHRDGSNCLRQVPPWSGNLNPAAFPLIFYYGDPGWAPGIAKLKNGKPVQQPQQQQDSLDDEEEEEGDLPAAEDQQENIADPGVDQDVEEEELIIEHYQQDEVSRLLRLGDDDEDIIACSSDEEVGEQRKTEVSMNQFVRARGFDRTAKEKDDHNPITGSKQLSHCWWLHNWIAIDRQRLEYQERICDANEWRYDQCQTLRDALQRMMERDPTLKGKRLGKVKLLKKTYRGGKTYMQEKYRDGIAISSHCGQDDLFVTFTGNPTWPEIEENLREGEKWIDRPDLVCRVFNLKAAEFMKDLFKRGVLGKVVSYKVALEHQKRGMPHLHILLCFAPEYKLNTVEKVDNIICSMLAPEVAEDDKHYLAKRRYYDSVLKMMIHDPSRCAVACGKGKKNGKCSKGFAKDSRQYTFIKADGYALPKRPADGRVITIKRNRRTPVEISNQWVVSHNRFLLLKYGCHINIEHCGGSKSIKYIHKYMHKGPDCAWITVAEQVTDAEPELDENGNAIEVEPELDEHGNPIEYVDYNEYRQTRKVRVISAAEAVERTFNMFITKQSHTVITLPVHLPAEHNVPFKETDEAEKIERLITNDGTDPDSKAVSMLTASMKLVRDEMADSTIDQNDKTRARHLFYHQIPQEYSWQPKGYWKRRVRKRKTIGRLQSVMPTNIERYCLRELLKFIPGPSCYEDLKKCTRDGVTTTYETFREAAVANGLFIDDASSDRLLEEVCSYAMPKQCRRVFALILLYHQPEKPKLLWDKFREHFWSRRPAMTREERERGALAHVASILYHHNMSMAHARMYEVTEKELYEAINHTFSRISKDGNDRYALLNELQKYFVDAVFHSFDNPKDPSRQRLFFLQAGGGCGKTFVFNTIIRILIENGYKVVSVASTGIAAVLLDNGQTAHSAFRIPLDLSKPISLSATNRRAELIRQADIIIWDEAPMQHKDILDKAAELIKDMAPNLDQGCRKFGNKTIILGGDFKQLLPVVKHETVRASFEASLLCSKTFLDNFNVYTLKENMRAKEDPEYAAWCNDIGNGKRRTPFMINSVQIPPDIADDDIDEVTKFVYPEEIFKYIERNKETKEMKRWNDYINAVKDNALLSPLNEKVNELNSDLTKKLPGVAKTYTAVNILPTIAYPGDEFVRQHYDSDSLNAFEDPGIPPHQLKLRVGSVVMLSRNLDTNMGLCNGTRMVVKNLFNDHVLCQIITGKTAGKDIPIFAIKNTYEDPDQQFPSFVRHQLPLRQAFAMTINKSQGQTLVKVGLILDAPCFSHGQFYVAITRVRKREDIKIYVPPTMWGTAIGGTDRIPHAINVVFPEVIFELDELIKNTSLPIPVVQPASQLVVPPTSHPVIPPASPPVLPSAPQLTPVEALKQAARNLSQKSIDAKLAALKQKMAEGGSRHGILEQNILMAEDFRRKTADRQQIQPAQQQQLTASQPQLHQPQQRSPQQQPAATQPISPPAPNFQDRSTEDLERELAALEQGMADPGNSREDVTKQRGLMSEILKRKKAEFTQQKQRVEQIMQQQLQQQQLSPQQQPAPPSLPTEEELREILLRHFSQPADSRCYDDEFVNQLLDSFLPASAPAQLQQFSQQPQQHQPSIPPALPCLRRKEQSVQDFLDNGPSQPPRPLSPLPGNDVTFPLPPLPSQWEE